MLWAYGLGVCFEPVFWAYALGVCFKCMALESMASGASLWVRCFGRISLGVWILPKKPEANVTILLLISYATGNDCHLSRTQVLLSCTKR